MVGNLPTIHFPVRRLDKPIVIDASIGAERGDQPDVRTFRGFDRADSAIMGGVDVPDLKPRPLSSESAGAQCRQPSLVRNLRKRVRLVHKLGKLARTKELF